MFIELTKDNLDIINNTFIDKETVDILLKYIIKFKKKSTLLMNCAN